jgi:hypothetical protein
VNLALNGTAVLPPGLTVTANLQPFQQVLGTPSASQSYTVTGTNLTGNVTITPPARYQVSTNGGTTWTSAAVTIAPTAGQVNATVLVRLNAALTGVFNGNITHASTGTATQTVAVTGTTGIDAASSYRTYPVPTYQFLFVSHPVSDKALTLFLYNSGGQKVAEYHTVPGTPETRLQVGVLPAGIYYLHFETGTERKMIRFIKQ